MSGNNVKGAGAPSVRSTPPESSSSGQKVQNKQNDPKTQNRPNASNNPNVANAHGQSNVETDQKNKPVNINPPANEPRTYSTKADAERDYKELKSLSEKENGKYADAANRTFATLVKYDGGTDEYKAEMARQVATAPGQNLNLTRLSQLPAEERAGVVDALRTAHQSSPLDRNAIMQANHGPGHSPTHAAGLLDEATRTTVQPEGRYKPELTFDPVEAPAKAASTITKAAEVAAEWFDKLGKDVGLSSEQLKAVKGFAENLGPVLAGAESLVNLEAAQKAFQDGKNAEGAAKLIEAGAGFADALAGLGRMVANSKPLQDAFKAFGSKLGPLSNVVTGAMRFFLGNGKDDVTRTDQVVGATKVVTGLLQFAPPGPWSLVGAVGGGAIDILDKFDLVRPVVEGVEGAVGQAQQTIQGHQQQMDELRRQGIDPQFHPAYANPSL